MALISTNIWHEEMWWWIVKPAFHLKQSTTDQFGREADIIV